MKALVTGAAGFIGSHLSEELLERGDEVLAIDRLSDYYDPALKRDNLAALEGRDGFSIEEASLLDADLGSLLEGVDVVFHLAGQPGVRVSWGEEFQLYVEDNVLATQKLLEAAKGTNLDRFVYASSSSIYGDAESFPTKESATPRPVSPYGVTKLAAEHLCMLYAKGFGVPATAVRYFTIFGPRQRPDMAFNRFIRAALGGETIRIFGDGEQERDFTYVGDAVAGTMAAGERGEPGTAYNIAGGNSATVNEVIATIGDITGGEVAVEHEDAVIGDARKTGADTSAAAETLGYEARTSLRDGLAKQVEAERERLGKAD